MHDEVVKLLIQNLSDDQGSPVFVPCRIFQEWIEFIRKEKLSVALTCISSFLARTMPRKVSHGLDYDDDYDEYDDYDYYDNDYDVEEKGKKLLALITFYFLYLPQFLEPYLEFSSSK